MTELSSWQLALFLAGLIAVWSLIIIAMLRWIQDRSTRKLEIDFLKFLATLPIEYVRREDAIRQEVVTYAKLDALYAKMDNKTRDDHE